MGATKVANRRQLTGSVMSRDATPFNLISSAVSAEGVNIRLRNTGLRPSKRLAKEIFREIASRAVSASRNASRAKFIGHLGMEGKQSRGRQS